MNLKLQKRLGIGGSKHPWRRGYASWFSNHLARRAGGGLVFAEDDEILRRLRKQLSLPDGPSVAEYLDVLTKDEPLARAFQFAKKFPGADGEPSWPNRVQRMRGVAAIYYGLLREYEPEVIVETGTAAGGYTAFAMAALAHNKKGKLISIDLPPVHGAGHMILTIDREDIGYYIPQEYRDHWDYRVGDAKVLLPQVLTEVKTDVFIHDSLHTTTHMLFEYAVARTLMRENSLILSDDIMWNGAFQSFLSGNQMIGYAPYSRPNTGVCVNAFDAFEREAGLGIIEAPQHAEAVE